MGNFEIHAHVETASSDCDGHYTSGYTMTLSDAERAAKIAADGVNDFTDIEFHNRVLASVVNTYSLMSHGTLTVRRFDDGDVRLMWSEATDEGYRNVEATICTDDCVLPHNDSWMRDHRAEAMGY